MSQTMSNFPAIKLDTTLADLYRIDDDLPLYVPYFPNSEIDFTTSFPRTRKYIYQSEVDSTENSSSRLIHHSGIYFMAIAAQRYMFAAGNMPVAVFDILGKCDVIETLSVFPEAQKPDLRFFSGPVELEESANASQDTPVFLAMLMPMDVLEKKAHVLDPALHYELLSKRGLALSGLKTPDSQILDLDDLPGLEIYDEQSVGQGDANFLKTQKKLDSAVNFIARRPLPFALKMQQTISGHGTFLIRTEAQRQNAITSILPILKRILVKVDVTNNHLRPSSLVIQDLITCARDRPGSLGVNFFVLKNGQPVCLGIYNQELTGDGSQWAGGSISYPSQDALRSELTGTMHEVASFLQRKGYHGPAGVDVVVDDQGQHWIVDLNVRSCGAVVLGLLRGHFEEARGLRAATMLCMAKFPFHRKEFQRTFADELALGRVIITSWFDDEVKGLGWASLVLGAEDQGSLKGFVDRVRALEV